MLVQENITIDAPVGTIIMHTKYGGIAGYLLCDGAGFDPAVYPLLAAALGRSTTPNLRSSFPRATADQNKITYVTQPWRTRLPRTPFVLSTDGQHNHTMAISIPQFKRGGVSHQMLVPGTGQQTSDTGAHSHAADLQGGDSETVPIHVYLAYLIRHDPPI